MKKKNFGVVICTFMVLVLSFIFAINFLSSNRNEISEDMANNEVLKLQEKTLEYGSSLEYAEFIDMLFERNVDDAISAIEIFINDKKILNDDIVNFNLLGKVIIRVSYKKDIERENIDVIWEVKDTKAPQISGVEDIEITLGDKLKYEEMIKAEDECDDDVKISFEGEIDEKKPGRYSVKVLAIDKSGNMASEIFYVTIKDKENKTTSKITTTKKSTTSKKTSKISTVNKTTTTKLDVSTKKGRLALAKAEAKVIVKKIIKPGMSDAEKAQAISTYLYENVARQLNQSSEAYKTNYGNEAYAALVMKIAACSGFCKAVTLLCDEAGLKSQHINANQWTHQWNKVYVDGKWQVLDAQLGYFGGDSHPYLE